MPSPHQAYGVYVDQGATDVLIEACDVRENSENGVYINGESGAVTTDVFVRGCNATGYSAYSTAISVNGTILNVQVTDCAGYNDTGVAISYTPISGASFSGPMLGYYGPLVIYAANGTAAISQVQINGHVTHLTQGTFYLSPGTASAISVTFSPPVGVINLLIISE
jgi:hypothetical protein